MFKKKCDNPQIRSKNSHGATHSFLQISKKNVGGQKANFRQKSGRILFVQFIEFLEAQILVDLHYTLRLNTLEMVEKQ